MAPPPHRTVTVLGRPSVLVGRGLLARLLPADLAAAVPASRFVVVVDEHLQALHLPRLLELLPPTDAGPALVKVIPPSEASKSRAQKAAIEDFMLEHRCDRKTCIVALGGGVVGDLAGFVAATYLRGIAFVQIPTSLLAMVDSSVGGKTAINPPAGKNLIGAFCQPRRVYIDLDFLDTLPQREYCNGIAEIIKMGAVFDDAGLFALMERHAAELVARANPDVLLQVVFRSVELKAEVVTEDEHELLGLRGLLNFGHTVGHAIEALVQPDLLHGECVAIGMVKELEIARALGHCSSDTVGRVLRVLKAYALPTRVPDHLALDDIMRKMALDKKNDGSTIKMVLLRDVADLVERKPLAVPTPLAALATSNAVLPVPRAAPPPPATVRVPGSKSISNRVLLMAALGTGTCRIRGLLQSDDTHVMMDALQALGCGSFRWEGRELVVEGGAGRILAPPDGAPPLYMGNAGTATRFITSVCTLATAGRGPATVVTGNARMKQRPIGDLVAALVDNGCPIEYLENDGFPPLRIPAGDKGLPGGAISLAAGTSSQYVSSILISAPYARTPVVLALDPPDAQPVSLPYIDMTCSLMKAFGVEVSRLDGPGFRYSVPTGAYQNPPVLEVEADASSATYPLAIAAITGAEVTVDAVGSASVQGDAQFHSVISRMGCKVSQTASSTTVHAAPDGKPAPLDAIDIDLGDMTDSFMTLAALAAVARGTTRIRNIANQRVKECNRLAVMVEELGKVGVPARELSDGIEIDGCHDRLAELGHATIDCHDDHRIAMSFAVLGCRVPGIVISDKECVNKTYLGFWHDLTATLGAADLVVATANASTAATSSAAGSDMCLQHSLGVCSSPPLQTDRIPIFLIGMRGAGKSHLGRAAAKALGRPFVDLDDKLAEEIGMPLSEFVKTRGWPAFRDAELECLRSFSEQCQRLATASEMPVVACGGGIVETPECRTILGALPCVIQIVRDIDDIVAYLDSDGTRPAYGEPVEAVWERRKELFLNSAGYDFSIAKGEKDWRAVERDFHHFVSRILAGPSAPLALHVDGSFFLSLTFPDLAEHRDLLAAVTVGCDAVELRIDLLADLDPRSIYTQVAMLRRHCPVPIIYTVRSKSQGGKFDGSTVEYNRLICMGIRMACEYVDIEVDSGRGNADVIASFVALRGASRFINSSHWYRDQWSVDEGVAVFERCLAASADPDEDPYAADDIIKVILFSSDAAVYNKRLEDVKARVPALASRRHIACCAGQGKLSRCLNKLLCPVTHPALPAVAAPGQLSIAEIERVRATLDMIPPRETFLFGTPISASPSPAMHNTGFEHHGLPYSYGLFETDDADKAAAKLREDGTLGGSITIPLKEKIIPHIDVLSPSAKAIGAVNTVLKLDSGRLFGTNTDTLGIRDAIVQNRRPGSVGLVVGAGGTARAATFALIGLGLETYIYNPRTPAKAQALAAEFGCRAVSNIETDFAAADLAAVVGTVPGAARVTLPDALLATNKPTLVEMAYRPRKTALVEQAEAAGCVAVEGVHVLVLQGLYQFVCWTKLDPPKDEMMVKVLQKYESTP